MLRAHFADMPQALPHEKVLAVAASLRLDLPHETIVKQTKVAFAKFKELSTISSSMALLRSLKLFSKVVSLKLHVKWKK